MRKTSSGAFPKASAGGPRIAVLCKQAQRRHLQDVLAACGLLVVAMVVGVEEALASLDLAIVDLALVAFEPGNTGDVLGLSRLADAVPIVAMVTAAYDVDALDVLLGEACVCVGYESSSSEVETAISAALGGRALFLGPAADRAVSQARSRRALAADGLKLRSALSKRELEVLNLMARGWNNQEIGAALFISPTTVKDHVAHILAALRCRNRVEAAAIAIRSGAVPVGDAGSLRRVS